MDKIVLGAYTSVEEALDAKSTRQEPLDDIAVESGDDIEHPFVLAWYRKN